MRDLKIISVINYLTVNLNDNVPQKYIPSFHKRIYLNFKYTIKSRQYKIKYKYNKIHTKYKYY